MNRPKFPVPVWFQPELYLEQMKTTLGVNIVFGPSVENEKALAPDVLKSKQAAWIKHCADLGLGVVLTTPISPVPANCLGWFIPVDEPNGHSPVITAGQLQSYVDAFRAVDKTLPIFIDIAGSAISSANWSKKNGVYQRPAEPQLFLDYASLDPKIIFTVDAYSANRNASRYPMSWTADIITKMLTCLAENGLKREVWAWIEANDQQLAPPPVTSKTDGVHQDINRAPTAAEIVLTWNAAVAAGASGVGPFLTCDTAKYGWPDSFFPQVDRNKMSMASQYAEIKTLATAANGGTLPPPPTPTPVPAPVVVPDPIPVPVTPIPVTPIPEPDGLAILTASVAALKQQVSDMSAAVAAYAKANAEFVAQTANLLAWAKGLSYKSA